MAMRMPSPPHAPLDLTDTESAEECATVGAEHGRTPRGQPACRLVAGAAGTLLVVAVVAAAASPPVERKALGCEGRSCMTQSNHLDKVLELKQNTMALGDCPPGYFGTALNIRGKGKQWTIGNLTACATVCDQREGCKGFEFHVKNGKCGTYTDGYVLGGMQFYRWLTCVREGERAANAMFTINNLGFETLDTDPAAKEALESAVQEAFAKVVDVPPHKVGVGLSAGSTMVSATIAEGGIPWSAEQLTELLKPAGPALFAELTETLMAITSIVAIMEGDLSFGGYTVQLFESWDPRTTTASEAPTTSDGER